jgi:hypothetical protein
VICFVMFMVLSFCVYVLFKRPVGLIYVLMK